MDALAEQVLTQLAFYDLKREPNGEYRSNSPLRKGANSHSFHLKLDDSGGTWYDHASGDRGTLIELAQLLGLDVARIQVADTLRVYRDLADYAEAHGVTADYLKKNGWSEKFTYQGRPALSFKTATGMRYRFLDGQKPKYKSELDYKASWYGSVRALKLAAETGQPIALCNGEVSTLVGQYYGVAAMCFTGSSERGIPSDLLTWFQQNVKHPILIALDCDRRGREAAQVIHRQLPQAVVIDFGLGDKGDLADFCKLYQYESAAKLTQCQSATPPQAANQIEVGFDTTPLAQALTTLAQLHRMDEKARKQSDMQALLAQAKAEIERIENQVAKPIVVSFAELAAKNRAALQWAMEHPDPVQGLRSHIPTLDRAIGGFLPEMYDVYGATGMGKSWFCVTLAKAFIEQAPGLIVTTESMPGRWYDRLTASITGVPADRIETGMVSQEEAKRIDACYDRLADLKCDIVTNSRPTPNEIKASAFNGDYKWVIVDSASNMAYPGATDIYSVVSGVADSLQEFYRTLNVPIIATSQVGRDVAARKNKIPRLEDGYGSGKIEFNAGVLLALYRHGYYVEKGMASPHPKFPPDMTLVSILKNRWRPQSNIFSVQMTFVGGGGFGERVYDAQLGQIDEDNEEG